MTKLPNGWLGESWLNFWQDQVFFCPPVSLPVLEPTQPDIKWLHWLPVCFP